MEDIAGPGVRGCWQRVALAMSEGESRGGRWVLGRTKVCPSVRMTASMPCEVDAEQDLWGSWAQSLSVK